MALSDIGRNLHKHLMDRNDHRSLHTSGHSNSSIPANVQRAYITVAVLCLLMASMSIVVCTLSLKALTSFRQENEYLNAFIQGNLSNVLFMNKFLFIKDSSFDALLSPLLGRLRGCWRVASVHAVEYGPALALAFLTTHLFAKE